uniref:rRNA-processing protein UTP23 homolog n=1 Tax=Crassostrea virginica TaxID=6565 RepID=A0A8B8CNP1_CRAVI|nr:zinc transporter 7-like [Crassostrea virginica]
MLPLHKDDGGYRPGWSVKEKVMGWMRLIFSEKTSRNIFFFLLLNLSFAFVELLYGVWTNSLGLISDSFHMFFDCTALLAGLAASVISRWRANDTFSYGYVRAEVLAGFVNGLFLLFIGFFIFSEAIERLVEPPEVKHERLFLVSVGGFIVNLVGIFAFQHGHGHSHGGGGHGHSHGGHGHSHGLGLDSADDCSNDSGHGHSHGDSGHGHSHGGKGHGHSHGGDSHGHSHNTAKASQAQIMQGVFLHIMADTLGSVGVIISSLLIYYFGWMIADPVCSMFIAILITISVLPLLRDSVGILMQRTPRELDHVLPGCYQRVSQLEGVYSVQEPHFWTLCSEVYIGTIKLETAMNADTRYILSQTHNIFTQTVCHEQFSKALRSKLLNLMTVIVNLSRQEQAVQTCGSWDGLEDFVNIFFWQGRFPFGYPLLILLLLYEDMGIKRQKQVRKSLAFYKKNFGYSPPYYVLVDGTFCRAALKQKINIREQLPKYLEAEVNICTTQCILDECEAFGSVLYGPFKILQQYQKAPCGHSKSIKGADKCIQHTTKKTVKYIVGTQDPVLREVLRNRAGLPILYIAFNAIMLENPSTASLEVAEKKTETELKPTSHQQSVIQTLKKQTFGEETVVVKKKRKKIKGPNPLSCKKSKKKRTDVKPRTNTEETKKRRRRKKKHKHAVSSIESVS